MGILFRLHLYREISKFKGKHKEDHQILQITLHLQVTFPTLLESQFHQMFYLGVEQEAIRQGLG